MSLFSKRAAELARRMAEVALEGAQCPSLNQRVIVGSMVYKWSMDIESGDLAKVEAALAEPNPARPMASIVRRSSHG